jgi:hypothetical protein
MQLQTEYESFGGKAAWISLTLQPALHTVKETLPTIVQIEVAYTDSRAA